MAEQERPNGWLGLAFVAAAAAPYLAASNVLPSDDEDFGVPRWVLAWIVFICFFLPGLMVLGGVRVEDGGRAPREAGLVRPTLAAVLPALVSAHAALHAFTRTGSVRAAWLALAALSAWVAYVYARRIVRAMSG